MKKHILIVSQYFYPEPFRINDIALELYKKGYKITVITGIPNYPEGKFYKGYNWFCKRKEKWNGVDIVRLPILSRGRTKLKLVLNYYSYSFVGKIWATFAKIQPDLVLSFGLSPIMQALVGLRLSKRRHIPHYLYVQDLWPESLEVMTGIHKESFIVHYGKICKKIYNQCEKVFATTNSFVNVIKTRIDNPEKVLLLPQYPESIYIPTTPFDSALKSDKRFKIIYTGNIGKAQGLDILVEAAKQLDNVLFIIVGDGRYKSELIKLTNSIKDKFYFIDRKEPKQIPGILACADVAFLSLKNNKLFNQTIPAKVQTYMACGMPILALADGETKKLIETAECGLCSSYGDLKQFIINIKTLNKVDLSKYRKNSINYVAKYFNKNEIISKLLFELNLTS